MYKNLLESKFFKLVLLKWDAITVSLVAIVFGWFLIRQPQVLDYSDTYDILSELFTSLVFGWIFSILGALQLASIIFDWIWLRIFSISLLVGLWILFGSALMQNTTVNSVYIHCFGWALICFGVAMREWVK